MSEGGVKVKAFTDAEIEMGCRDAVRVMRECSKHFLGFSTAFVDDEMKLVCILAQRAILAGLASDCDADLQKRFLAAAEPHREGQEDALGYKIGSAKSQ